VLGDAYQSKDLLSERKIIEFITYRLVVVAEWELLSPNSSERHYGNMLKCLRTTLSGPSLSDPM